MLPDRYLPEFHFSEKHSILISASASIISTQIAELNVADSWIIRTLLMLRGIPRKTSTGIEEWKKMGFVVLEHQPDQEIILGLIALENGLINEKVFVSLVIMAIVTSMSSGPLMKWSLSRTWKR